MLEGKQSTSHFALVKKLTVIIDMTRNQKTKPLSKLKLLAQLIKITGLPDKIK